MVRESGISSTKPVFPGYLLPSIGFTSPFRRRSSGSYSSSSSVPDEACPSTAGTTPDNSPPSAASSSAAAAAKGIKSHLTRAAPDTLRCSVCSTDLAFASQIVSKGFTGRHGRAFLVAPPADSASLLNIRIGKDESRQLVTGWHVVADISCTICSTKVGWKYVNAKEPSQKYKIGKYILETQRIVTFRQWEDASPDSARSSAEAGREVSEEEDSHGSDEVVEFDSEDDEECEDIFAGTWDAGAVARRRSSRLSR